MKMTELAIPGAYLVLMEPVRDDRGHFTRIFCREEFRQFRLDFEPVQTSFSFSPKAGTLRGVHFQLPPRAETKLIRCTRGSFFDVMVDLRPDSPMFSRWVAVELSAGGFEQLYVPEGVGHGVLTLEPDTEVFYHVSEFYSPAHARGVRWDDPALGITWPMKPTMLSDRDRALPALEELVASGVLGAAEGPRNDGETLPRAAQQSTRAAMPLRASH